MPFNSCRNDGRNRLRLAVESLESRQLLAAGPYAPAADEIGSTAIDRSSPAIIGWASAVVDYSPGSNVDAEWTNANQSLGPAEGEIGTIVSLGRGGTLTLSFENPIRDGLGFDFAVFENAFSDTFLELGFVEVSSDGVNFFRFESDSRTPADIGAFGTLDPTNLNNLAGKYRRGFGTPFDLQELRGTAGLDVTAITQVRMVDIVGDGGTVDGQGDPIFDPTPTVGSAGLDVDGVAVLNAKETGLASIDFETLGASLGGASFSNQADGGFAEQELRLNNDFDPTFGSWRGWAISQTTDTTTEGFTNQFSNITGSGRNGSDTYAVAFFDASGDPSAHPTLSVAAESASQFDSFWVTNTTYAALSMANGDSFAKKFGGDAGTDPDFLELDVVGLDAAGVSIGTVTVVLADYRFENPTDDFILDDWLRVDVSSLAAARSLQFSMRSSDVGDFGINTPTYFAIDDVTMKRPLVAFDLDGRELLESGSISARVSRPSLNTAFPMTVTIDASPGSIVTVPGTVTIPAGVNFVDFTVNGIDNEVVGTNRSVELVASVTEQAPQLRTLTVIEDDLPRLTWSAGTISTTEGQNAAIVTLQRDTPDASSALNVTLDGEDLSRLNLPATVAFPAGQRSVQIAIGLVDDDKFSPTTPIVLQAFAEGHIATSITINAIDDDVRSITLDAFTGTLSEFDPSATLLGRVRRNDASLDAAMIIALTNPADDLLTMPSTVTIAAGSAVGEFTIGVIDNETLNQNSQYAIVASHPDVADVQTMVTVVDNETPPGTFQMTGPADGLSESNSISVGDFETIGRTLVAGEFTNNAGGGTFIDGGFEFGNSFSNTFGFDSWSGFAISRTSDTTTPGFFNQYSAIPGEGARSSSTYAVGYAGSQAVVRRPDGSQPFSSIAVTNTTYAALSMRDGDSFAKKFGGLTGDDPDTFVLTIEGFTSTGETVGEIDFYLADFRPEDNSLDTIIDQWTTVDLSPIGQANELRFRLTSTDIGQFGMNTPGYFAIDDVMLASPDLDQPMITLQRESGDLTEPVAVALTADRTDILLPASVVIPAGESTVRIPVRVIDNSVVDGSRDVVIVAAADGFDRQTLTLQISDDDVATLTVSSASQSDVLEAQTIKIDFEDLGLAAESFDNGSDGSGSIDSGPFRFANSYNAQFDFWSGWAASNVTDVTTAGFENQYAAYSNVDADPAGGGNDSDTYLIGTSTPTITLPTSLGGGRFASLSVTNTTYAARSMQQGDSFAKKFGGETGNDPDFFLLTIIGLDDTEASVGKVDFYLADYRFEDNSLDYIVDSWSTIDLTSLEGASQLRFELSSSDLGDFGMNTPAYIAVDDLMIDQVAVDPASVVIHRNDGDLSQPLTVALTSDEARLMPASTIEIPVGSDSVRVPIAIANDRTVNSQSGVVLSATATTHSPSSTTVVLLDDEVPGIKVTPTSDSPQVTPRVTEKETTSIFGVRLSARPTGNVTVSLSSMIDSGEVNRQVTIGPETFTFTPDNWSVPQEITVQGKQDLVLEPNQTITLTLSVLAEGSDPGFLSAVPQQASFVLMDSQPSDMALLVDEGQFVLSDAGDQQTILSQDANRNLTIELNELNQTLTLGSMLEATGLINVDLGDGDDQVVAGTNWFTSLSGGDGFDRLIIEPTDLIHDLDGGTSLQLDAWLRNRVVGFEEIVLGSPAATSPILYRLDSERLNDLFGQVPPSITILDGQNFQLDGAWQLGVPILADGLVSQRLIADAVEVRVITSTPWRNSIRSEDVDANGVVSARDALIVINRLNSGEPTTLGIPGDPTEFLGRFYDVSGDGMVSALDALRVINFLNQSDASNAAGESIADAMMAPGFSIASRPSMGDLDGRRTTDQPATLASTTPVVGLSDPSENDATLVRLIDAVWGSKDSWDESPDGLQTWSDPLSDRGLNPLESMFRRDIR